MIEVRPVPLGDPLLRPLIDGLTAEYHARYGPNDEMSAVPADEFEPPEGLFLALVADGVVIAGGGYRKLEDGVCEVKRMWTDADHRRLGHASTILAALESKAAAAGYHTLRLETGPMQPEAAAMYTSRGYRRIPYYGRYRVALAFERSLVAG